MKSPNPMSVAVSRAQQRLYVIGDCREWSGHRHFDTLNQLLRPGAAVSARGRRHPTEVDHLDRVILGP